MVSLILLQSYKSLCSGKLIEAEDNMNCQIKTVTATAKDGRVSQLEYIYLRGSKIRFMVNSSEMRTFSV